MNLSINKYENNASQVGRQPTNESYENQNYPNELNSEILRNHVPKSQQKSHSVFNNYCATGPFTYRNSPLAHPRPMYSEPGTRARYANQPGENFMRYNYDQFAQQGPSMAAQDTDAGENEVNETSAFQNLSLAIDDQQRELTSLKSALHQALDDNGKKAETINNQNLIVSNLQSENEQLQEALQQANSKMQQMFYTATDIGLELREKTKELAKTKSNLDQVSSLLEESVDKVVYILQTCSRLEEESYELQSDLETQNLAHKDEMDKMEHENQQQHLEICNLIEKFQTQKSHDEKIIEAFKTKCQMDRGKISMLKAKLEKYELEKSDLQNKMLTLKVLENKKLLTKVAQLKSQNLEQAKDIKQLQQSCKEKVQQVKCLESQITSLNKNRKKLHEKYTQEKVKTSKSKIPARIGGTN